MVFRLNTRGSRVTVSDDIMEQTGEIAINYTGFCE